MTYYDVETGTNYNYFRDYDPGTGRYVESDPIGQRGGINTFAYVTNAPTGHVDPRGLVKWSGNVFTAAAGPVSWENYDLVSECKCGVKLRVRLRAYALSYGGGATFAGSFVDLEDRVFIIVLN